MQSSYLMFARKAVATALTAVTLSASGQAGSQVESVCGQILDHGIRNNYYLYTESELYTLYKNRLCDLKSETYQSFASSASSLGLDLPVAEGIIGLDASSKSDSALFKSKYSAFCASSFAQSDYKTQFQIRQSEVSSSLTNAWKSCTDQYYNTWLQNNAKGVTISAVPQDNFADVTVFVRRKSAIAADWLITGIAPAQMQCSYKGAPVVVNKTKVGENDIQLNCTKNPNSQADVSVASSTDGTSNVVRVPAAASRMSELLLRNNELAFSLEALRRQVGEVSELLAATRRQAGNPQANARSSVRAEYNHNDTGPKVCPDGYVVVGIAAEGRVVGNYAQGAIAGLTAICARVIP